MAFIKLKDWHLRDKEDLRVKAIQARAMKYFSQNKKALIFVFPPPSIIELGNATGFDFQLMDMGGLGHQKLMEARNQLLYMANQDPRLKNVRPNGLDDIPEFKVDIDWEKAGALGVPITSIHNTVSAAFGSAYVNDFIKGGRVKRVFVWCFTTCNIKRCWFRSGRLIFLEGFVVYLKWLLKAILPRKPLTELQGFLLLEQ